MTEVKVCGVTRLEDAKACAKMGVDAIGLNFWPGTPRCVDAARAVTLAEEARTIAPGIEVVGVFVDAEPSFILEVQAQVGLDWVQLHGAEPPSAVEALLPRAYKAVGVADLADVEAALAYPGERLLLDARVPGAMPGGTGHRFDWALAEGVATQRHLTLAGGLRPTNVTEAIERVRPARVDVASGVEVGAGIKDKPLIAAFLGAVRAARLAP